MRSDELIPVALVLIFGPEAGFAGGGNDRLEAAAIDRQGRLVAAGYTRDVNGKDRALLVRYQGDQLELMRVESFGDRDRLLAVAIDARDRIIVAGKTSYAPKKWNTLVARFLPDGTRDPSFGDPKCSCTIGQGGALPFSGSRYEAAHPDERFTAVVSLSDGRLCAAGASSELSRAWFKGPYFTRAPWFYRRLVACFTPNGSLHSTPLNAAVPAWTAPHDELVGLDAVGDKLVAVGWAAGDLDYRTERALVWTSDRGVELGPLRAEKEVLYDVLHDAEGTRYSVGFRFDDRGRSVRVLVTRGAAERLEPKGAFTGAAIEYAAAGVLDAGGRLLIAGFSGDEDRPILARYSAALERDPTVRAPDLARTAFLDLAAPYAVGVSQGRSIIARLPYGN